MGVPHNPRPRDLAEYDGEEPSLVDERINGDHDYEDER